MRARQLEACARLDESIDVLEQFLDQAPPGFAAWSLPIDPLLRSLDGREHYEGVRIRLSARAG
jgi:hypothetical protein